jgi:SAM-dependent methyltransferase
MNAFDYWRELQLTSPERAVRLDAEAERARWQRMAPAYNRNALHVNAPAFAHAIAAMVRPGETVLEIGPGTGGFTVPVAGRAARVLAVDMSDAMLGVLRAELAAGGIENVETMLGEWPDVTVPVHDVVLAVNSLYRVLDVRTAIERMSATARRRVIVAWSVGHNPPVLPSVVDPQRPRRERPGVTYIHLLLALHELGIATDLTIHHVPRAVWRESYADAAGRLLAVADPTPAERAEAAALARVMFAPEGDGVVHRYEGQVAVISWQGRGSPER